MVPRTYTLNFMGDTMLGRLIDQMFPTHVHEPEEARIVQSIRKGSNRSSGQEHLVNYAPTTPWGNTLPLLHSADLNLLNLETSATTHDKKWPNKVFNYRMHPANVSALRAAKIDYAGLANNHTLDFCEPGLLETVRTVKDAGIAFAGAGESREEATKPAILKLKSATPDAEDHEIYVWTASDHPEDWSSVPTFHFIDYTAQTRKRLKELLTKPPRPEDHPPALKIFSVHWGPNYAWQPAQEIQDLAHYLIDDCGIDIIHGHSSHHVQGVEIYNGKLIIYGCGDFVDDYALTPGYRNDLSGVWRVTVSEEGDDQMATAGKADTADDQKQGRSKLKLKRLEVYPTIIERFRARRLDAGEADAEWVRRRIKELSKDFGTEVEVEDGGDGRLIVHLS